MRAFHWSILGLMIWVFLGGAARSYAQGCQTFSGLTYATYVDGGGQTQPLQLELLVPSGASSPIPLVIWIHGGGWTTGGRTPIPAGVSALCSRGYAVASIDYRLALTASTRWPAQIQDSKAAVRWLRANAAAYNLDPDRFAVWGPSAGGQLAAMVGTAADVSTFRLGNVTVDLQGTVGGNLDVSSRVQAVVAWYAPVVFLQMRFFPGTTDHDAANSPESRLLGGLIQDNPLLVATADPLTFATPDDPPFLLMHGTLDDLVPFHQSELLAAGLRARGVRTTFVPVANAIHGGSLFNSASVNQTVYDFLDQALLTTVPTVSVEAADANAAEAGSSPGTFRISRTGGTAAPLEVRWALGGTARPSIDYATPFKATIPAGASSVNVQVVPSNDLLVEGDESVLLALANDPAWRIDAAAASAAVTLADNDSGAGLPQVSLSATDPTAAETGADGGTFTVSLSGAAATDLTVRYTFSGTARNSVDYAALPGAVTVPAGELTATITLLPVDDALLESTETVILTLEPSPLHGIAAPAAGVRIADTDFDPALPIVSVMAIDPTASEPGSNTGAFQVTRTGGTGSTLIVDLVLGGEAKEGPDFTSVPNAVLFDVGVSRLSVNLTPTSDTQFEGAETATLSVGADDAIQLGPQGARVTIADDEIPGTAGFYPLPPCRLVDTRALFGPTGAPSISCDGSLRVFEISGACGVAPDATAVSLNVTAVNPTVNGYLTLFETGGVPVTSTLNVRAGQTRANSAIVPLTNAPRTLALLCGGASPGTVDVILDVNGYFK